MTSISLNASRARVQKSPLCSTCNQMLESPLAERCWEPHHGTLEGLKAAISQSCSICSILWRSFSEQHRTAWTNNSATWQPMLYEVYQYKEESEHGIVRLWITYMDPIKDLPASTRFYLLPLKDDEFGHMFCFPHLEAETSSTSTRNLIHEWYLSCCASHEACRFLADKSPWRPTRLLDIGIEGETEWKLDIVSENVCQTPSYMTLSYRWGPSPDLMLLTSNIGACCQGKPIADLPQTFKDTISVVRLFSVRYLWIDVLCIIQDSQEDWEIESANMRRIYSNSLCNVAASAAQDPHGGLFRSRNPGNIRPGLVSASFSTSRSEEYYMLEQSYAQRQIFDGPLHRRGWVFQERLLAPRVLHFTDEQVFWECFTEHKCEAFPHGIPMYFPLKQFDTLRPGANINVHQHEHDPFPLGPFNLWNDLVQEYTKCEFTRPSDRLVAFAGLAHLFRDSTGDQYVAGLWRSWLPQQLDWRVHEPTATIDPVYRTPSWSWASLDGPVRPQGLSAKTEFHVSIVDVQVESSRPNGMGEIMKGHIRIKGIITHAICSPEDTAFCLLRIGPNCIKVQFFPDALNMGFDNDQEVCCLLLRTEPTFPVPSPGQGESQAALSEIVFLLLVPQHSMSDTYRRIGYFALRQQESIEKFGIRVRENGSIELDEEKEHSVITIV